MQQYNNNQAPFFNYVPRQSMYFISNNKMNNQNSNIVKKSFLRKRLTQLAIDLISVGIVFAAFGIVYNKLDPRLRYFDCSDSNIFFPNLPDIIPFWVN
jgi:hypothetical protein